MTRRALSAGGALPARRERIALGALLLLVLAFVRCGADSVAVVVKVSATPAAARTLRVQVLADRGEGPRAAQAVETFTLPEVTTGAADAPVTFALRVPRDAGALTVAVAALSAQGCLLSSGVARGPALEGGALEVLLPAPPAKPRPAACPERVPLLLAVSPGSVPVRPAATLTLTGFGFLPTSEVTVAGVKAQVRFDSPLQLTATVELPLSVVGAQAVVVKDPGGSSDTLAAAVQVTMLPVTLVAAQAPAALKPVNQLLLGDVNGDARLDLLCATGRAGDGTDEVLVVHNTPAGLFTVISLKAPTSPLSLALGDLDRDGRPDLVVQSAAAIQGWKGDAAGVFEKQLVLGPVLPAGTLSYAVLGLLTGNDDRLDLVLSSASGLVGYAGMAAPPFAVTGTQPDIGAGKPPRWVGALPAALGLPGDVVYAAPGQIGLWPQGLPTLVRAQTNGVQSPLHGAVADMNGDGQPDLVYADDTYNTTGGVGVALTTVNAGQRSLSAPLLTATGNQPRAVAVGDLNGDGRPDVVTVGVGGIPNGTGVVVLLNRGGGALEIAATPINETRCTSAALGDLNNDGKLDLVFACEAAGGRFYVYHGQ